MKKIWVSASEVGQSAFCPHSLELKYRGVKPSKKAVMQMENGNYHHKKLNEHVDSDKRCFIATHLYGLEDIRTYKLRQFRDRYLIDHWLGRTLVKAYYWLSPYWVRVCEKNRLCNKLSRTLMDYVIRRIV